MGGTHALTLGNFHKSRRMLSDYFGSKAVSGASGPSTNIAQGEKLVSRKRLRTLGAVDSENRVVFAQSHQV